MKKIQLQMNRWREQRTEVFENCFDWSRVNTCLYVGARVHQFYLRDVLVKHRIKITILEIFPPNVEHMMKDKKLEVILGNAVSTDLGRKFDMVLFWNGPEHVKVEKHSKCFENLSKMTTRFLVLGAPYGKRPQGTLYGNKYEIHVSTLTERDFPGYDVVCIGPEGHKQSQLIAIKRI